MGNRNLKALHPYLKEIRFYIPNTQLIQIQPFILPPIARSQTRQGLSGLSVYL